MSQAVSHQPSAAEAQFQFLVCPCRNCGGQIGTERGFSQNIFIFPCKYHSTNLHIHLKHDTFIRKTNNAILFQITNLMHNSFILQQYVCYTTILNMFRSARCLSSGGQIVSPQPLVSSSSVNSRTVCRWRAD